MRFLRHLTWEMLERIIADVIIVNIALAAALTLRSVALLWLFGNTDGLSSRFFTGILYDSATIYPRTALLLTALSVVSFSLSGFYTYGRVYRGRYKALIIVQAVSVSYLAYGFLSYFAPSSVLPFFAPVPRSAWLTGWIFTLAMLGGVRLWAMLWRATVWAEAHIWRDTGRKTIRNVLVIGGAGYIGSLVVRKLLDRGYNVKVLDALVYGDAGIVDLYGRKGFEFIHDDLRNIEAVVQALQYTDAVVHLGALVGDPACAINEQLTVEINLAATRMIAEAARGMGIRHFVFASTCSVYGASNELLNERSALNPISLYARTKISSERVLLSLTNGHFAPVILRFGTIYGLSPRPRFDLVINQLAAEATRGGVITIFGGDQWRPFVHVDDAAEAILRCLEAPLDTVRGQVFNVGSDEGNYRIAELGAIIKEAIPDANIVHNRQASDQRDYRVSFSKIRRHLGFLPRFSVRDGIAEIKAAIEKGLISDYTDARYSNYKTLADEGNQLLIHSTRMASLYAGQVEDMETLSGKAR